MIACHMRILITDDHHLFADGLRMVLEDLGEEITCVVASSAEVALGLLNGDEFDLFVVDLHLPGIDGISLLKSLAEQRAEVPIVVISATESLEQINSAIEAGARGFVPKSYDRAGIQSALKTILNGEIFLPADIKDKLQRIRQSQVSFPDMPDIVTSFGITKRQFDVLENVAKGYSNKEIANAMFVTEHTVKVHLKALFKTLDASNRTQLSQIALDKGILP